MLIHEFAEYNSIDIAKHISYNQLNEKRYITISDDTILMHNSTFLKTINTHWNTIDNLKNGLNYYGISIILLNEIPRFIEIITRNCNGEEEILKLIDFCYSVMNQGNNIVHFGV